MATDAGKPARPPFQKDFFNERTRDMLYEMGESVVQAVDSVFIGLRNRQLAQQAIFTRYLTVDDIVTASWVHAKARRGNPDTRYLFAGTEYLRALLYQRSKGRYIAEMFEHETRLPPPREDPLPQEIQPAPVAISLAEILAQETRHGLVLIQGGRSGNKAVPPRS